MDQHPWVPPAAVAAALTESVVLVAYWSFRAGHDRPLTFASTVLAVKAVFCVGLLRRRPGAVLGLFLLEVGSVAFNVVSTQPVLLRLAEITVASAALALLAAFTASFPTVRLPER
jgi:hypothetical protein